MSAGLQKDESRGNRSSNYSSNSCIIKKCRVHLIIKGLMQNKKYPDLCHKCPDYLWSIKKNLKREEFHRALVLPGCPPGAFWDTGDTRGTGKRKKKTGRSNSRRGRFSNSHAKPTLFHRRRPCLRPLRRAATTAGATLKSNKRKCDT